MQLSVMRSECRAIINEPDAANSHFTEAQLTTWANEGYRYVQTKLGVIPKKSRDYATPSSSASPATITLNSRMLTIDEAYLLAQPDNKYTPLEIIDMETLAARDPNWLSAAADIPNTLVRTGTFEAALYPPPNAANQGQTIKTYGLEFITDLVNDTDTPDLPLNLHDVFPPYMAYRCYKQLQDQQRKEENFALVNSILQAQKSISVQFSKSNMRWKWADDTSR